MNSDLRRAPNVTGEKRFPRLHKVFNDAVQSNNESAVVEVLLRAQLSGENARRTAQKILSDKPRGRPSAK